MAAPQPVLVFPETRPAEALAGRYSHVRRVSLDICEPLQTEDYVVQSMPDASPTKWHLAHTSWFFEKFVLEPRCRGYRPFRSDVRLPVQFLLPDASVAMHERPQRGLLTRPTVDEVLRVSRARRRRTCSELLRTRAEDDEARSPLATLGLHHEQQHQELMLTDIKHLLLAQSAAARVPVGRDAADASAAAPLHFVSFDGGVGEIGATRQALLLRQRDCRDIARSSSRSRSRIGSSRTASTWSSSATAATGARSSGSRTAGRRSAQKAGRARCTGREALDARVHAARPAAARLSARRSAT